MARRKEQSRAGEYHVAGVAPVHEPVGEAEGPDQLHERLERRADGLRPGQQRRQQQRVRRQRVEPRRRRRSLAGHHGEPLPRSFSGRGPVGPRGGQCRPARGRTRRMRRRRAWPEDEGAARHCHGAHHQPRAAETSEMSGVLVSRVMLGRWGG